MHGMAAGCTHSRCDLQCWYPSASLIWALDVEMRGMFVVWEVSLAHIIALC